MSSQFTPHLADTTMPSASDARQYFSLPSPFAMKRGGELIGAQLAYETWGRLNAQKDNAILILTGMSPSAHAASNKQNPESGWWEAIIGPNKPIDTNRFFIICANSLGGDKGSTGPASINPVTGEPYRLTFPDLSLEDVANAAFALVTEQFGISRLASLIGCSMGGMGALAYLLQHENSSRTHISINTAPQAQPFAIAIRSLQREAIRLDPLWNEGNYCEGCYPTRGMSVARKLGVITYRSAVEWNQRFARIRLDADKRSDDPLLSIFRWSLIWIITPNALWVALTPTVICICHAPAIGLMLANTGRGMCMMPLQVLPSKKPW